MSFVEVIEPDEVKTTDDLIEFIRSRYGVIVTWQAKRNFKSQFKSFLEANPHIGGRDRAIQVIVKAVLWGKDAGKYCRTLHGAISLVALARAAGALPELDPRNETAEDLQEQVYEALAVETDKAWRNRLIVSRGAARERALAEWREYASVPA